MITSSSATDISLNLRERRIRLTIKQQALSIKHNLVPTLAQCRRNLPSRLQPSQLQETLVAPDCLSDKLSGPSLSLCSDDDGLLLLDRLVDQERRSLSDLLGDLLCLDGVSELGGESDVGDGDIVQDKVEAAGSSGQVVTDQTGNHLSLSNQLRGVELSDDRFEDFIDNRREDSLVVVCSEFSVALNERYPSGKTSKLTWSEGH